MKDKWVVFRDYYLVKTVIAVIIVAGLVHFCYGRMNEKKNALQVMMMDVRCTMEQQEAFEKKSGEIVGIDSQKEYVDISFCESPEMLFTLMFSDKVDIFFMNQMYYEVMMSEECLYPLEENTYGFSIKENPWIEQFQFVSSDDVIIGIAENAPNARNAHAFVEFLLKEKQEE